MWPNKLIGFIFTLLGQRIRSLGWFLMIAGGLLLVSCGGGSGGDGGSASGASANYYFAGTDGTSGPNTVLWKSNGTAAGTVAVTDAQGNVVPTINYSMPNTAVGSLHYFPGYDDVHGTELWRTDGTAAGTYIVKDIDPTDYGTGHVGIGGPQGLVEVDGIAYFNTFDDGTIDRHLWMTDGTEAGSSQVLDSIDAPVITGVLGWGKEAGLAGVLYFTAVDSAHGAELWRTDGTPVGTYMVKDIMPGNDGSTPMSLTVLDGVLYFTAQDNTAGWELWRSDGTEAGTARITGNNPGAHFNVSNGPSDLIAMNGTLYFSAFNDSNAGLWKSDGTEDGTVLVKTSDPSGNTSPPNLLLDLGGLLVFQANDGTNGQQLWCSDGTEAGTRMVKKIGAGLSLPSGRYELVRHGFVVAGNTLYFRADDGVTGNELWKSNGTEAGTVLVKDINPAGSSDPDYLAYVGGKVFFGAEEIGGGYKLWITDGTTGGTRVVKDVYLIRS
jgi:ELWxxDGT repeat protein